ncbi:MAG: 5-formyltetrahydrofolate cyclo-ligase [Clostridia bacterium]|nr:5-formyltetrahydrofolate cyclo-ligase [Clostridia bacterium]MDE7329305.1 5-formyltetrahydrofolate cyclo-ligase [Clostridia bacterium]
MEQDKASLRKVLRARLAAMSDKLKALQSEKILEKVKELDLPSGSICIYNSLPSEVDTKAIIEYFIGKRKVYLPVVDGEELRLVEVDEMSEYRLAKWGILEPVGKRLTPEEAQPKVTITPLLGVDKSLNRLGKGKGFYDRYFEKVDTLRIGLAFKEQIIENALSDSHDKSLDMLVTIDEVIKSSL